MRHIQIYRCKDCGLEVALTPPVIRPCPSCGGDFASLDIFDAMGERSLYTPVINRVIEDELPRFFHELDKYMEIAADYERYKKDRGINE